MTEKVYLVYHFQMIQGRFAVRCETIEEAKETAARICKNHGIKVEIFEYVGSYFPTPTWKES